MCPAAAQGLDQGGTGVGPGEGGHASVSSVSSGIKREGRMEGGGCAQAERHAPHGHTPHPSRAHPSTQRERERETERDRERERERERERDRDRERQREKDREG